MNNQFLGLTYYLRDQHDRGNNILSLSFDKLKEICGLPASHDIKAARCVNDGNTHCSLGWMLADYLLVECNQKDEQIVFQYNPDKVEATFLANS